MGMTSSVLHEEEEPQLKVDTHGYEIHSLTMDNSHTEDPQGRPVINFDRWKILQSDIKDKQETQHKMADKISNMADSETDSHLLTSSLTNNINGNSSAHSLDNKLPSNNPGSSLELSPPEPRSLQAHVSSEQTQRTIIDKPHSAIVKKPRPNSLAILSRSHDFIHTLGEGTNQEVSGRSYLNAATPYRAVSADTLLEPGRPLGLQQRRNQRPTSLHIPSLTNIPLETCRTANPYESVAGKPITVIR